MLHSIFAPENTNLIRDQMTHLLISISTQTIRLIKALPNDILKQISNISFDKATFDNATPSYNDILPASGYQENLTYQQDLTPSKKVRQRKIIWFNPPYSVNVETNIGKTFLKLIDKHFPKINKFHKIFNRNNVKVSYSSESCLKRKPKINLNVIADRKILVLQKDIVQTRS